MMTKNSSFKKYMIFTFLIAWVIEIAASFLAKRGVTAGYQILLIILMYAPFAGVLLSCISLKGMGWKPRFKGRIRYYLVAWWLPAVLAVLGGTLFFLIRQDAFDLSGSYLIASVGEGALEQLLAQGLTLELYYVVVIVSAITFAPIENMFFALGEEVGWRGYLYPVLKEKFGKTKGRLIGGVIWGIWHWPLMILAGYEYGTDYFGAPVLGLLLFCLYATVAGILIDELYEKTECIWVPALAHGAINAATFPILFLKAEFSNLMIAGPVMVGAVSMIPMILVAIRIECKKEH